MQLIPAHRRKVEEAIHTAEHPKGMSVHDGMARIDASILRRLLAIVDSITVPDGWKLGDELAPFHPDASHVEPGYRDGWNDCYRAMLAAATKPGDSNE